MFCPLGPEPPDDHPDPSPSPIDPATSPAQAGEPTGAVQSPGGPPRGSLGGPGSHKAEATRKLWGNSQNHMDLRKYFEFDVFANFPATLARWLKNIKVMKT